MTALPFIRKNNLLSLLRGYDLPIKHNYLNTALLGYGKHNKDKDNEERYQKFRSTVDASLDKYFNTFREEINNNDFWQPPIFYKALCAFTRYYVAGLSVKSSQFFNNIDGFLSDIVQTERYNNLVETMEKLANKLKYKQEEKEILEKYNIIKENSKKNILKLSFLLYGQTTPDIQKIMNLILDCIVYSTNTPEDFVLNWEKYKDTVAKSSDKDTTKIFSEDLQDTLNDDLEEESDGEYDSEDERFVVPDDVIEYEDDGENPVKKKRRRIVDSDDEEGEVNGSGFYNWWWG